MDDLSDRISSFDLNERRASRLVAPRQGQHNSALTFQPSMNTSGGDLVFSDGLRSPKRLTSIDPPPATSKAKKYAIDDSGAKGRRGRSSRDSGIGSSSSSTGVEYNLSSAPQSIIVTPLYLALTAAQEALDTANEKIRVLERHSASLESLVGESSKENRLLKRGKGELHIRVEYLQDELDDRRKDNDRLGRKSSRRTTRDRILDRTVSPPRSRRIRNLNDSRAPPGLPRRVPMVNIANPYNPFAPRSGQDPAYFSLDNEKSQISENITKGRYRYNMTGLEVPGESCGGSQSTREDMAQENQLKFGEDTSDVHSDEPVTSMEDPKSSSPTPSPLGAVDYSSHNSWGSSGDGTDWEADSEIGLTEQGRHDAEHTQGSVALQNQLSQAKTALVDRLMGYFWVTFNQNCGAGTRQHGQDSSQSASSSTLQATGSFGSTRGLKRARSDHGDEDDHSESNRQGPRRIDNGSNSPETTEEKRKFACPYRKQNPRKYSVQQWRSCALTPHKTVARVKLVLIFNVNHFNTNCCLS